MAVEIDNPQSQYGFRGAGEAPMTPQAQRQMRQIIAAQLRAAQQAQPANQRSKTP